jgi:hypothetical protein
MNAEDARFESLLPIIHLLTTHLSPSLFMALMVALDRVADTVTSIDQKTVESAAAMQIYMENNRERCDKRLSIAITQMDKGSAN